jgi:hypothetical protein
MIKYYLFGLVCLCCFSACNESNNSRGIDSKEVAKEIRSREIRHITQAQVLDATFKQGQLVADSVQTALTQKLILAVSEKGIPEAAKFCNLKTLDPVARLEDEYQATIKRMSLKDTGKKQALDEVESQLLSAYRYNAENKLPLKKNVQKSGSQYLLFTAPINISNQVCLKCHGIVGKDVAEKDFQALRTIYPMDSLVNYTLQQSMAIYSILFQRKGIIANINAD